MTSFGVAGSLLPPRLLETLLFGVTPYDVPTYAIVIVLPGAIPALASYLAGAPRRALEPVEALRNE